MTIQEQWEATGYGRPRRFSIWRFALVLIPLAILGYAWGYGIMALCVAVLPIVPALILGFALAFGGGWLLGGFVGRRTASWVWR